VEFDLLNQQKVRFTFLAMQISLASKPEVARKILVQKPIEAMAFGAHEKIETES
jgi:hypothetical protein